MRKSIIIIFVCFSFISNLFAQESSSTKHVYSLNSSFYYLNIFQDETFTLKIGMYDNQFASGKYKICGDTLKLNSIEFTESKYEISELEKHYVENAFSTFLIHDSLLIPIYFREPIPLLNRMSFDSTLIKTFVQSDGHVNKTIRFYSDSTFIYKTGSDMGGHSINGKWLEENNIIYIEASKENNCLNEICLTNKFVVFENYLVGITIDDKTKTPVYHYLRGAQPED